MSPCSAEQELCSLLLYSSLQYMYCTTVYRKEGNGVPYLNTGVWRLLDEQNRESTDVFLGKCSKLIWQQLSTYSSPSLYLRTLVPCFSSFPSLSFMNSYVCVRYFIKNQWPYSAHCHSTRHPRPLMYSGELGMGGTSACACAFVGVGHMRGDFIERWTLPSSPN
jgi:hypothetical protein